MPQKQNMQIGTKKLNNQTFLEKRKINHKKKKLMLIAILER